MKYDGMIKSEKLREAYKRNLGDTDLTDQRDDLALLRAMCEVLVERHSDVDDRDLGVDKIQAITNMLMQVDKLIKSISDREAKQKFLIHIDQVARMVEKFTEIITRHIRDPDKVRLIVADITAVEVPAPEKALTSGET